MSENNVYRELIKTPKTYLMQLVSVLNLLVSALLCFEEIEREDNLYIHFNQPRKLSKQKYLFDNRFFVFKQSNKTYSKLM